MPTSRPDRRTDLEALRGLAVLLVVAYHAGVPGLGGAFVAVDVFFLLSGFFMGRSLVQEYATTGALDLGRLYRRRAVRLLPQLLVVVAATLVLVWTFWAPIDRAPAAATAPAVLAGLSNVAFARTGVNYFAGPRSPFVHTWSLGVELQLSLLVPLLFVGLAALGGGRRAGAYGAERARRIAALVRGVGGGLAAVGVLSLGYATWIAQVDPARAYFSTMARAWVFAAGVLLALALPLGSGSASDGGERRGRGWWLQAGGLAAIALPAFLFDRTIPYPGTAALLPVLGGVAFVAGGIGGPGLLGRSGWFARGSRWLGKVSYSWYLWHWPIVATAVVVAPSIGVAGRLAWSAAALLPAWLTWRWVERPLREHRDEPSPRTRRLPIAVGAGCVALALVAVAMHRAAEARVARTDQRALAAARDDRMRHECWAGSASDAGRPVAQCSFGDPEGAATVALFGDSHAEHWLAALDRLGRERGWRVVLFVMGGCPVADAPELVRGSTDRHGRECARWRESAVRRLVALHPDVAVLSNFDEYVTRVPEPTTARVDGRVPAAAWARGLRRTYARVAGAGIPVVAIRGTPRPGFDVPACLSRRMARLPFAGRCEYDRDEALHDSAREAQLAAVRDAARRGLRVTTVDMTDEVCAAPRCGVVRDGIVQFTDDNHLTASFTRSEAGALGARLDAALAAIGSRLP